MESLPPESASVEMAEAAALADMTHIGELVQAELERLTELTEAER